MLRAALETFRLSVKDHADGLEVTHGKGLRSRTAIISATVSSASQADCVAYAAGLKAALARPLLTAVADWEFTEVAGRLVPTVERVQYREGFLDGGGGTPWEQPFAGPDSDLRIHYYVELDQGHQLLTAAQVETWGVTDDRVMSAARSLLFHKTMQGEPERHETGADWYRLGDGYDAARALALPDLNYARTRKGLVCAAPTPYDLLVLDLDGLDVEEFSKAVAAVFAASDYPLSEQLYIWRDPATFEVLR
jgi:hypothetical protein